MILGISKPPCHEFLLTSFCENFLGTFLKKSITFLRQSPSPSQIQQTFIPGKSNMESEKGKSYTLSETSITFENRPSQTEIHLPTIDFQVRAVTFREGI